MGDHIQVNIVRFDENDEECIAIMNGLEVRVDPFLATTNWDWSKRDSYKGEWIFSGQWYDGCFLPYRAVREVR